MVNDGEQIRLVQSAIIAGKSYRAMLDAVLRGDVNGHQDAAGRWWVSRTDAERMAQSSDPQSRVSRGQVGRR